MTMRRASLARWAAYGLVIGLIWAALHLRFPWAGDGIRINLIDFFTFGVGYAITGVLLGALWNWAGNR